MRLKRYAIYVAYTRLKLQFIFLKLHFSFLKSSFIFLKLVLIYLKLVFIFLKLVFIFLKSYFIFLKLGFIFLKLEVKRCRRPFRFIRSSRSSYVIRSIHSCFVTRSKLVGRYRLYSELHFVLLYLLLGKTKFSSLIIINISTGHLCFISPWIEYLLWAWHYSSNEETSAHQLSRSV